MCNHWGAFASHVIGPHGIDAALVSFLVMVLAIHFFAPLYDVSGWVLVSWLSVRDLHAVAVSM